MNTTYERESRVRVANTTYERELQVASRAREQAIFQSFSSTANGRASGGSGGRPEWFWNPVQYGGILCDIGSHQVEQFLYYTGSTEAEIAESQIANVRHP